MAMEIDQELARRLLVEGATLIFMDVPVGTEFGIDLKSWNTEEKFKGVKMIPPGIHIVHYSAMGKYGDISPKVSFMHNFKKHEILVKKWDIDAEDMSSECVNNEELERFKANLFELDQFLGCYPFDTWPQWKKLSNHISELLLERLNPECGVIRSALELVKEERKVKKRSRGRTVEEREEELLPNLVPREGSSIRITDIPEAFPEGCSPAEVTKHSMDSTYTLEKIILQMVNEMDLLGELQYLFICFLVGQSLEAMESWKILFRTLCRVRNGLVRRRALYSAFLKALETQLIFIPEDFLVDIVASNNVIYSSLRELFRSMKEEAGVEPRLKCEAEHLKERLTQKFFWDFEDLEEEVGDEAPVIVDLQET